MDICVMLQTQYFQSYGYSKPSMAIYSKPSMAIYSKPSMAIYKLNERLANNG